MVRLLKIVISVNIISFLLITSLWAGQDDFPRMEAESYIHKYTAGERELELKDFISMSLEFSGISMERLERYESRLNSIINDLKEAYGQSGESLPPGEFILDFMHDRVLTRYSEKQTLMDVLLDRGIYNCVSSASLYLILGYALDQKVWGVKTHDHAFCRISTDDEEYDVETTNKSGFNPGEKKEFTDEFGNTTGFSYVPPGNYRDREEISPAALLGLILHNRVTFLSEKRAYEEALGPAVDYYVLLKDQEATDNLVNALQNVGAYYNLRHEYLKGIRFYGKAAALFGEHRKILKSRGDMLHNHMISLINEKDFDNAEAALGEFDSIMTPEERKKFRVYIVIKQVNMLTGKNQPEAYKKLKGALEIYKDEKQLNQLMSSVTNNWVVYHLDRRDYEKALETASMLHKEGDLSDNKWKDFIVFVYQNRANDYMDTDTLKAASIIEEGIALVGRDKRLSDHLKTYLYNYEVEVHNKMIGLYNSGKYRAAYTMIEEALKKIPGNKRLLDDLKILDQVMN